MKLIKRYHIELSEEDKTELLENARDISQGISAQEFVDYVEILVNGAAMMVENELNN